MTVVVTDFKFIADRDLSKLAKVMRMLGFDCDYQGGLARHRVIRISAEEHRILLTQATIPDTLRVTVCQLKSQSPAEQITQVIQHLKLANHICLFSRCLICNGHLISLPDRTPCSVPDSAQDRQLPLFSCPSCERLYWPGGHVDRML